MPVTYSYQGKKVLRLVKRADGKITLIMPNRRPGERHPRMVVSQEDWRRFGNRQVQ